MDEKTKENLIAFLASLGIAMLTLAIVWALWSQRGG